MNPIQSELSRLRQEHSELLEALEMLMPQAPSRGMCDEYDRAQWDNAQALIERIKTTQLLAASLPVAHEPAPPVPESLARDLAGHRGPRFFREVEYGDAWEWRDGQMTFCGESSAFANPAALLSCPDVYETDEFGNRLELSAADIAAEKADRANQAEVDLS